MYGDGTDDSRMIEMDIMVGQAQLVDNEGFICQRISSMSGEQYRWRYYVVILLENCRRVAYLFFRLAKPRFLVIIVKNRSAFEHLVLVSINSTMDPKHYYSCSR